MSSNTFVKAQKKVINDANLANGVYGHLKDLTNVNSSNTFFDTFQSLN